MTSSASSSWGSLVLHKVDPTEKEIGRGAYGRVFEVNYEGTLCAAKEVHALLLQYSHGSDLQKIIDDFLRECQIWSMLRHTCIVQFLGVYYPAIDQYRLPVMVMEKMYCSLRDLVERYDNIPLNVKLSILSEVSLGLRYLHSRNPPIVHRDLTPNNILLGGHLEAKITDLGVAKVVKTDSQKTMTRIPGTPDYMPPEALNIRPVYGTSLDIFSYGGVILNTITQLWPQPTDLVQFNPDTGKRELVSEVTRRQYYLDRMTGDAADLKPLVMSCLDDHPKCRPTAAQVSVTIKRAKDACSQKSNRDGVNPIVWWAEVSCEQQSQVTSSLATALKEMAISNEQLKKENNDLKSENNTTKDQNVQLKTDNEAMKNENEWLKAEIQQLKQQLVSMESSTPKDQLGGLLMSQSAQEEFSTVAADDQFSELANIKWEEGAPAPVNQSGHTAVLLDGLVYVGGGYEAGLKELYTIYCYNLINNSWSSLISTPYCLFAMTALNNNLLIAGGRNKSLKTTDQVLTLDATGHLSNYAKMITARSLSTAAGYQGVLIITGGKDYKGMKLASTEVFNSTTEQWYTCGDLPQPYYWLRSVIVDDVLYLLGGVNQDGRPSSAVFTASLDKLSMHQLRWSTYQNAPRYRSAPVIMSVHGSHLLILGGYKRVENDCTFTSDIYKLNIINQSWEAVGHIPSKRYSLAAVSLADNRIVVMGGENDRREYSNDIWIGSCDS